MRSLLITMLLLAAVAQSGCLAVGGSRNSSPPTVGQQLTDLKIAYDQGTMSAEEYETARQAFLSQASYPPSNR